MPEPTLPAALDQPVASRNATLLKMLGIGFLVLLLLIPLGMIHVVLWERLSRRDQAIQEITSTWGREQMLVGPVMIVPYQYSYKTWKEITVDGKVDKREVVESALARAFFLPAALSIGGTINPSTLHRGIYEAVVYSGQLTLSGHFTPPDFGSLKIASQDVLWKDAVVTFAITDLRGTRETLTLQWGATEVPLTPGTPLEGWLSGIQARIPGLHNAAETLPFTLALTFNGSSGISVAPVGIRNTVTLASPWPDPRFRGAFLPVTRKVSADGFEATWQVSYYGRNYPQQWTDQAREVPFSYGAVQASLFGVDFLSLIDAYRNVERSIKYGVLFIVLIFMAFFLFEVLSRLRLHVFQYTLVGAGLCLFYLALLSLSEFTSFLVAYVVAAVAAVLLIALYSLAILQSGGRTLIITVALLVIYGFLYVILQMQDYALLVGTAGLFAALGLIMYVTRNIDWYTHEHSPRGSA